MHIAVNARMLTQYKPGGILRYARETLRRITSRHRDHRFTFIVDRPFSERDAYPDNVTILRSYPSFHPLLWYFWFEYTMPRLLRRMGADLFLSLDGFASLSTPVPTVTVIHDLNFHHYPGDLPALAGWYYRHFFPRYARKAVSIATVSDYSKQDLMALYGLPGEKITVTGNGVEGNFRPLTIEKKKRMQDQLSGGAPYFLSVGAIHPRKNLVRLLQAFDAFKNETRASTKLVLAGPRLGKAGDIFRTWKHLRHRKDVLFPGILSEERLVEVYGGADAFFLISYFEGFGIPVLEAMSCDVPVVAGDRTSLPEICGDAALLVDPYSVETIARAMKDIYFRQDLRARLVERGRVRKMAFSWDRTADLLWDAVERGRSA